MQALFFSHLVIDKLLKAIWVKENEENIPPFTHNLEHLYNQTRFGFTYIIARLIAYYKYLEY